MMKKFVLLIAFGLLLQGIAFAQNDFSKSRLKQLHVEVGMNMSVLDLKDVKQGTTFNNVASEASLRAAGDFGFRIVKNKDWLLGTLGASFEKHNMYTTVVINNGLTLAQRYQFDFGALNAGLNVKLFTLKTLRNLSFNLRGGLAANWLIAGVRADEGMAAYNLNDEKTFNSTIFNANYGIGFVLPISEATAFTIGYNLRNSLGVTEKIEGDDDQKYSINTMDISVGFATNFAARERAEKKKIRALEARINKIAATSGNISTKAQAANTVSDETLQQLEERLAKAEAQLNAHKHERQLIPEDSEVTSVFFPFKGYRFYKTHNEDMKALAAELKQNANVKVKLVGYSDMTGQVQVNKDLAFARAQSVRDYLVDLGVKKDRFTIANKGATNKFHNEPVYNRRVDIILTK